MARKSYYDPSGYYHGKICDKHPELDGLRSKARRTCLKCNNEASKKSKHRRKHAHAV